MPLTEQEEFELLSLKRKRAMALGQQPSGKTTGVFGKVPIEEYRQGERNIIGNIFERPAAAIRSAIRGEGYAAGAINPTNVPTFQEEALKQFSPQTESVAKNFIGGIPASIGGLAADTLTNPAQVLTMLLGKVPVGGGKNLGGVVASSKSGKAISTVANAPIQKPDFNMAGKVINGLIKPRHKDFLFGKNPGQGIAKEGIVANNFAELGTKVQTRIEELNTLSQVIRNTPENITKKVDLTKIRKPLVDALIELQKAPKTHSAEIANIKNAISDLKYSGRINNMSVSEAYKVKDVVSKMQKWSTNSSEGVNLNKALRKVYHEVDSQIDGAVPELKEINSRMADLISAKSAIANRAEQLQRQEGISFIKLMDLPFAAARSTLARTTLGKLLSRQYSLKNIKALSSPTVAEGR